jgi:hypothetical protein
MMLDEKFSIQHEVHEGHEEGAIGLEKPPGLQHILMLGTLRVLPGRVPRSRYQRVKRCTNCNSMIVRSERARIRITNTISAAPKSERAQRDLESTRAWSVG